MSTTEDSETESEESAPALDHSLKVEASSLGDEEMDFAKAMGFGDEPEPEPEPKPQALPAPVEAAKHDCEVDDDAAESASESVKASDAESADDAPVDNEDVEQADAALAAESESDSSESQSALDDAAPHAPIAANPADPVADDRDWEEIHPRSAAEGDQASLLARAGEILDDDHHDPAGASPVAGISAPAPVAKANSALQAELAAAREALAATEGRLSDRDLELERLRSAFESEIGQQAEGGKQVERLESHIDEIGLERDQLVDQLAIANSRLAETDSRIERLETSLRAARGALIPLPEGERALRAEVLGLRARLDEAAQENVRLAGDMASVATELAVATARVEDRQHEIDYHIDRADELEAAAREIETRLGQVLAEHKETVALATRLQAENAERRSTQAALEETLQARDLEIAAREEHLRVTREALTARDAEILELNDRLDEENHRAKRIEEELTRTVGERSEWLAKIARREARISHLTDTLARIEEAMGRPALAVPTAEDTGETIDAAD